MNDKTSIDLIGMEQRAKKSFGDERSPIEIARDYHNQLVQDNMLLIDESRSMLIEIEVLKSQLANERKDHNDLKAKYEDCSRRLGSIHSKIITTGGLLVSLVKETEEDTQLPQGVKDFAPKSETEKAVASISDQSQIPTPEIKEWK